MESKSNIIKMKSPEVNSIPLIPPLPPPDSSSYSYNPASTEIKVTASALNFIMIMENMGFRNNKSCFIDRHLQWCLENNIISKEISNHDIWKKLNIPMGVPNYIYGPNEKFGDEWPAEYWNFKLVKVTLKPGWKLSACEYGKFIIMKNDEPQSELLNFFTNVSSNGHQQGILDLMNINKLY